MKKFIQNTFTKIRDYFTANIGRKIFFWGLFSMVLCFTIWGVCRLVFPVLDSGAQKFVWSVAQIARFMAMGAMFVMAGGTLWDSMQSRVYFLKKIRDIQYDHIQTIYEKQQAGEAVEMTSTFTLEEKKYIRRRKWKFIFVILFKVLIVMVLFSLLITL